MKEPKWIGAAIATAIHDEAVYEFGGLAGIPDVRLLKGALERPRNLITYEPRASLFRLAAALGAGIVKAPPFNDGNKRTALPAARAFLYLNGLELEPSQKDNVATLVAVADGSLTEQDLAAWMERNSRRRND